MYYEESLEPRHVWEEQIQLKQIEHHGYFTYTSIVWFFVSSMNQKLFTCVIWDLFINYLFIYLTTYLTIVLPCPILQVGSRTG